MTSTLHGVGETIAYLPYSFGFVPAESVVLVGLYRKRVQVTARLDIPDPEDVEDAARQIVEPLWQRPMDDALLIGYSSEDRSPQPLTDRLLVLLPKAGVPVSHVLEVRDARWRATACSCGGCSRAWQPVPEACELAPVAEQVMRGVAPAGRRADLVRQLQVHRPVVAGGIASTIAAGRRCTDPVELAAAFARVLLDDRQPVARLPITVLADVTAAMATIDVRDHLLSWLMPDLMPPSEWLGQWPQLREALGPPPRSGDLTCIDEVEATRRVDRTASIRGRLIEWLQCAPAGRSVPILLLLVGLEWAGGGGALANVAVERALEIEPDNRLAGLMSHALARGLRPTVREEPRSA